MLGKHLLAHADKNKKGKAAESAARQQQQQQQYPPQPPPQSQASRPQPPPPPAKSTLASPTSPKRAKAAASPRKVAFQGAHSAQPSADLKQNALLNAVAWVSIPKSLCL